jgi:hypothetical protein
MDQERALLKRAVGPWMSLTGPPAYIMIKPGSAARGFSVVLPN